MENTSHECRDKLKQELVEVSDKQEKSICRGCLTTEHRMVNAMVFNTLFRDLTGITISPTDGLPQWLCYECSALFYKYNRFRSTLIESHHKLCQCVLESVPFQVNEGATPHLSQTSVRRCHITGTQTDKLEERIEDNYYTDMLCETENVKVKDEPMFSENEDNIVEEEYRTRQTQLAGSSSISDLLDFHIAVTLKHEEETTEEEASSQEPHVGTEAAQQHLHKHVGASRTWGHGKEIQHAADTTSTRHSGDAEEIKPNIYRDESINLHYYVNYSSSNVQSYVCDTCNESFSHKNLIITHIREHTAEKTFESDASMKHFSQNADLQRLIGAMPYKCEVCMKYFGHKQHFKVHMRIHTGEKPYKCEVCTKCFSHKHNLKNHMRTHTGEKPYKCDVCMKLFSRLQQLKDHLRVHTGDKPYKCDICLKVFRLKPHLKDHMRVHTGDKPYKCGVCMKSFGQKQSLNYHMRVHTGENPYKCDVCMKCFGQKQHFKVHMRVHTGDKPYKCDVCMKYFRQKQHLKEHKRVHIGDKPYKCDSCMKCFGKKYDLNIHMRVHTGDKPYKCDVCMKCFGFKSNLNKHMRVHIADKPYKCDVCLKVFRQKPHLKEHKRVHTGNKPYKCDVCMKFYSHQKSLRAHMRIHAGDKPSFSSGT